MSGRPDCACILLAAGSSSRLGYPKQLLRVDGETLLRRTARLASSVGLHPVCVVLGSRSEKLRAELAGLELHLAINNEWKTGMASSLRIGMEDLQGRASMPDRLLILVCDQVALSEEHLRTLITTSDQHPEKIVASFYRSRSGVPAIFPSHFFDDLLEVRGDQGARTLLEKKSHHVLTIPFPAGELDIDTLEDAARAGLRFPPQMQMQGGKPLLKVEPGERKS